MIIGRSRSHRCPSVAVGFPLARTQMSEVSFLLPRPYPTMHSVHNHNRDLLHEIPTPSNKASYSFISQTFSAGRMLSSCYASDFQSAVVDRPAPALRQPEWKKKKSCRHGICINCQRPPFVSSTCTKSLKLLLWKQIRYTIALVLVIVFIFGRAD